MVNSQLNKEKPNTSGGQKQVFKAKNFKRREEERTTPSMGLPRASTTRPRRASPIGTSTMAPVRLTTSPSRMSLSLPKTTTPTLSGSRFRAMPCTTKEGGRSRSRRKRRRRRRRRRKTKNECDANE